MTSILEDSALQAHALHFQLQHTTDPARRARIERQLRVINEVAGHTLLSIYMGSVLTAAEAEGYLAPASEQNGQHAPNVAAHEPSDEGRPA